MYNPTELMLSILTSEEAQIIIDRLSPIYGSARVFLWLIQAIGIGLDEVEDCKDQFDAQSIVSTATWSLKYYEDQYGVTTDTTLTDEQRRGNIFAAMRYKVPLNPKKMESILSSLGSTYVSIEENTGTNKFTVVAGSTQYASRMIRFLERAKPAHTIYEFGINDDIESTETMYMAFQAITVPIITTDFGGVS